MSISIKLEMIKNFFSLFLEKKMFPKRVYCCLCLMTFVDENLENLMINHIDGILILLKEIGI